MVHDPYGNRIIDDGSKPIDPAISIRYSEEDAGDMRRWHATNSALNGHLIVGWSMAINAVIWLLQGKTIGLMGFLFGMMALVCAHYISGRAHYQGEDDNEFGDVTALRILMVFAVLASVAMLVLSAF